MDKKQRKELQKKLIQTQKEAERHSLPFDLALFHKLLDKLDYTIGINGCDHTLRYTISFLKDNNLPLASSIDWLRSHGGYCDCEVLANIEDVIDTLS